MIACMQSIIVAAVWIIALICLGSLATWVYVFQVSLSLRVGDPVSKLLLGNAAEA